MTVQDYQNMINQRLAWISNSKKLIKKYKNEIEDLEAFIADVKKIQEKIISSSDSGVSLFDRISMSFVGGVRQFTGFIAENKSVYKGAEYKKACAGATETLKKARNKKSEYESLIATENKKIRNWNQEIEQYKRAILSLEQNNVGSMGGR